MPANATGTTQINQTRTGTALGRQPSLTGSYVTSTPNTSKCEFTCKPNYTRNSGSKTCVANTQTANCGGSIPVNAQSNGASDYTQTWNGSAWAPTNSWGYGNGACKYTCKSGYTWNGSSCISDPCPGYYSCGGTYQYCEGYACSADSSRCSTYCPDDVYGTYCLYGTCSGSHGKRGNYCHDSESCCDGDYSLSSCPSNGNCSSCGGKYKLDSCASGYTKSGDSCVGNYGCIINSNTCPVDWEWTCKSVCLIDDDGYKNIGGSSKCPTNGQTCIFRLTFKGYDSGGVWEKTKALPTCSFLTSDQIANQITC